MPAGRRPRVHPGAHAGLGGLLRVAGGLVALVAWLLVRGDRIELAGGELRLHRLLPILDVAIPLAELDFAGRRPGWVSVHHHGIPRQLPLLFPDGPYFAAAIQLMTGAPLR